MRRGLIALAPLLVAAHVSPVAVARTQSASGARSFHSVRVNLPLPAAGSARVDVVNLRVTASRGTVSVPSVRSLDESQLPPGIRAIAIIAAPAPHKRDAKYKVYIGINNLGAGTAAQTKGLEEPAQPYLSLAFSDHGGYVDFEDLTQYQLVRDCASLVGFGDAVDETNKAHEEDPAAHEHYYEVETEANETSNPEEILDHIVYNECKGEGAEVPELGPQ